MELVWRAVQGRRPRRVPAMVAMLVAVALFNAGLTACDYFLLWRRVPEVAFVWQWDLDAVAAWLDDQPSILDATLGGLSASSMDAPSLDLVMRREDVVVRWCDPGSPLGAGGGALVPSRGGVLAAPSIVPLGPEIEAFLLTELGAEPRQHDGFVTYDLPEPAGAHGELAVFDAHVSLAALRMPSGPVERGHTVVLQTTWVPAEAVPAGLKAYVHLLDAAGEVRAQHDGLDCPSQFWREGDLIVQTHALVLPDELAGGSYVVRVGLYDQHLLQPYSLVTGEPAYVGGVIEVVDG